MVRNALILVLLLLSSGCQPIAFEPEPHEPVSSFVTNPIDQSGSGEDKRPLYESNAKPRLLYVGEQSSLYVNAPIVQYCWSEESGGCVGELTNDPLKALVGFKDPIIEPSSKFFYNLTSENGIDSPLPFPTSMQLYLYEEGSLTPIGEEIHETDAWEIPFQGPAEEGKYVYVVKASYEADVNGVTHYAFHFRVRNDYNKP